MTEPENFLKDEVLTSITASPLFHKMKRWLIGGGLILMLLGFLFSIFVFVWFFCRIEVESGHIAILIKKTGEDLPSGEILALSENQKGIQLGILPEGRYFKNPYHYAWQISPITDIPAGKLGVQTRAYGQDLPPGQILAKDNIKGILPDVLSPGKYRINPYAYRVELFDAIHIRPGFVGVVTSLVGQDVQHNVIPEAERNSFLVSEGRKGVVSDVLESGTYYLNPYQYSVFEVSLQSQRFEMSGKDAISFLTVDGFTVNVEGTIEYSLKRDSVALIIHRVGDMEDVITKVILPRARGFSRIEGSKNPAVNYIIGETRQQFEDRLETHLQQTCDPWGVTISSVLIRNIIPPDQIASVIREREVAVQDSLKYEQQIVSAKSRAELVKQEKLAIQKKEKVEADTAKLIATIQAEREMAVKILDAQRELKVAQIKNESANFEVEAILAEATAKKNVIGMKNEATASVITREVNAFGGGMHWARHHFYERIAPSIEKILTNDDQESLGALFKAFLPFGPNGKEKLP